MRRSLLVAFLLISAATASASFRDERAIVPGGRGPNRLDVDATLLARAQRGLSDLRLFDARGREVPYLLVDPPAKEPQWLGARTLPIAATKKTSGFDAILERPQVVDRIHFENLAAPFLKRVRVEGSGDREHWTLLADATVFDLPEEKLRNYDVAFPASELRYVRATWDDRSSAPVGTPIVSVRLHDTGAAPEPLLVGVPFSKRASEPGKSRYRVTLPGPGLPATALELIVANGNVFRRASVTEPRLQGAQVIPHPLGSDVLSRAERGDGVAADMQIAINAPAGRDLHVTVEDGNNAPLAIRSVVAHIAPQPWIYFESSDGAPVTARFGDSKLTAPRYDLEASRKFAATARVAKARWSEEARPAPAAVTSDSVPVPPFGAAVQRSQFRNSRAIERAPRGLSVLVVDAAVLAGSNDLGDARIVNQQDRQIPYLVERREEPLVLELAVPKREVVDGRSRYRLILPDVPSGTKVEVTTPARVFERPWDLRVVDDTGGRRPLVMSGATWRNEDPDSAAPALTFEVQGAAPVDFTLDEGDNAPLPITSIRLLVPSSALRFYHPGGELALLYGAGVPAPRYDLALLAPRLFGESAREISLAAASTTVTAGPDTKERTFFWIVLALAAVVLLGLLARLLGPRAMNRQ